MSLSTPYVLHGFKFGQPLTERFDTAHKALIAAFTALDTGGFAVTRITKEGRIFMSDDEIVTEWLRRKEKTA